MKSDTYSQALEKSIKDRFGLSLKISQLIAKDVDVSRTAKATVFLTNKKQLYVYISAHSRLLLGDISKITSRMGLKADSFIPPAGKKDYFNEIGRDKFQQVFPGRANIGEDEIRYYKTLAPYSPALVQISEVKYGEIYRYDSDTRGNWRVATKFAYRRIRTS